MNYVAISTVKNIKIKILSLFTFPSFIMELDMEIKINCHYIKKAKINLGAYTDMRVNK